MKIRLDYVTNSSSTSYCMLGLTSLADMRLVAEAMGLAYEEPYNFVEVDYSDLDRAGYCNGHLCVGDVFVTSSGNALYEVGVQLGDILKLGDMKWSEMRERSAAILSEFLGRKVSADEIKLLYGEAGDG